MTSSFSTQGTGDLQPNRASKAIRIVVWALAGLAVVVTLVLGVTAVTMPGCTLCHSTPVFAGQTAKSAHANVDCARCHVQPDPASRVAYAYHVVFGMGLHIAPPGSGPITGIPNETCLSCHRDVMKRVVRANGLSIKHSLCAKARRCTDCHSTTAHGTAVKWPATPQMNQCLDCHSATRVRSKCTTCHAARTVQQRLRTGEWAVTHGPNWKQTHGMGDWKTCASCHPENFCVKCHGLALPHSPDYVRFHALPAETQRQDCAVCHQQTFCDSCHGLEMPHPPAFTPAHSSIVKRDGQAVCKRCHVQDDCTNCHVRHVHPGGAILPPTGIGLR